MIVLKLSLPLFFLFSVLFVSSWSSKLSFSPEGEFTVLQFTDLHYGQSDGLDANTLRLQRDMIARVKPDLIVVSGDGVSGNEGYILDTFHSPNFYKRNWEKFTKPISEAGIPYAFTIGNHDLEADLDRYQIAKLDMTHPLSVRKTSQGIPDTLNFYFPIYSSQKEGEPAVNIWLFDTGRKGCMGQEDSWGCVEEPQIKWYEQESKKIKEQHGIDIHHIAFIHIPIPEYQMLSDESEIYGRASEFVSCPNVNSGFFKRVKAGNDISAIFVGHDHSNNFGGWSDGIELVYGQKSGYGNYGGVRGVRVLKFKESVDTNGRLNVQRNHYIIFENGTMDTSKNMYHKQGEKQGQCPSAGFDSRFVKLREAKFFDYVLLVFVILLVLAGVYSCWRVRVSSRRKEQINSGSFTEMSEDVVGKDRLLVEN